MSLSTFVDLLEFPRTQYLTYFLSMFLGIVLALLRQKIPLLWQYSTFTLAMNNSQYTGTCLKAAFGRSSGLESHPFQPQARATTHWWRRSFDWRRCRRWRQVVYPCFMHLTLTCTYTSCHWRSPQHEQSMYNKLKHKNVRGTCKIKYSLCKI